MSNQTASGNSAATSSEGTDTPPQLERIYSEPRNTSDRRRSTNADSIPSSGCRRRIQRRATVYLHDEQWWLKRNYNNGL